MYIWKNTNMKYFVYSFNHLFSMHFCLVLDVLTVRSSSLGIMFKFHLQICIIPSWNMISVWLHLNSFHLLAYFSFFYKVVFININIFFVCILSSSYTILLSSINLILMRCIDVKIHSRIPDLSYSGSSPIYRSTKLCLHINL